MQITNLLLHLIFLCLWLSSSAQQNPLHFTIKDGLSQNSVTCIFRDSRGFVWIGPQDGLNRFDGYRFRQYKYNAADSSSISDQYITVINEDEDGNIWVGTRNGLNILDISTEKFRRIHPDPYGKKEIQYEFNEIVSAGNGDFIITKGREIFLWKKVLKKLVSCGSLFPNGNFSVYGNQIWSLDENGVAGRIDFEKKIPKRKYPPSSTYFKQFIDRQHTIWFARISAEAGTVISFYSLKTGLLEKNKIVLPEEISHISFDLNNQAWVSTRKGIFIADYNGNVRKFSFPGTPEINGVLQTYTDKEGLTWIGFAQSGLAIYNPDNKIFSLLTSGIKNDPVFSSMEKSNGEILLGAASGLYSVNPHTKNKTLILKEKITAMAIDGKNYYWLAVENAGIFILNTTGKIIKKISKQTGVLPDNKVFHLQYDAQENRMLISTQSGFVVWFDKDQSWKLLTGKRGNEPGKLMGSYILHSFIDSKKNIWLSSNSGLDQLDAQLNSRLQFNSNDDTAAAIKRTIITGCTEDGSGNLWIATLSNGVYLYRNNVLKHFNTENGLSSNVIYAVLADKRNRIWIASSIGINVLDPESDNIIQLSDQDGLPAMDYMLSSFRYGKQDDFFIASPEGLIRIEPQKFEIKKRKLQTYIHSVVVNYEPANLKNHYVLKDAGGFISFEFSAPGIINADKIYYEYRLKGFENKWIRVKADNRRINFTNLPFGNYQLELRSAYTINELKNAPVTVIQISRLAPFWRTPLFLLFTAISILTLLSIVVRFFTKQKMERKLRAAEMEQTLYKERERISRDLHDNLGAYAAAIKSNVSRLTKETNSEKYLLQLRINAEEMVNALRETIWALQYPQISIISLSDRLKDILARITPSYPGIQIQVKEEINKEINISPSEGIHLLRIIQESVTNALKHAQATAIDISITSSDELVVIIADNGRGFDTKHPVKGQGIQNMKQRSKEAGFWLQIESSGAGTILFLKKSGFYFH